MRRYDFISSVFLRVESESVRRNTVTLSPDWQLQKEVKDCSLRE